MGPSDGEYIKVTNFGFSLPSDATPTAIKFSVVRKAFSLGGLIDNLVYTVKGGVIGGDNNANAGTWLDSDENLDYAPVGAGALWGRTWLYTDINASDFGIVISPHFASTNTAYMDYVSCTITYTTTAAGKLMMRKSTRYFRQSFCFLPLLRTAGGLILPDKQILAPQLTLAG